MHNSYLHELSGLKPGNELYASWLKYALTLEKKDILGMVRNGLTYQAEALRSMIRELVAGGIAPPELFKKLDLIVLATRRHADNAR